MLTTERINTHVAMIQVILVNVFWVESVWKRLSVTVGLSNATTAAVSTVCVYICVCVCVSYGKRLNDVREMQQHTYQTA